MKTIANRILLLVCFLFCLSAAQAKDTFKITLQKGEAACTKMDCSTALKSDFVDASGKHYNATENNFNLMPYGVEFEVFTPEATVVAKQTSPTPVKRAAAAPKPVSVSLQPTPKPTTRAEEPAADQPTAQELLEEMLTGKKPVRQPKHVASAPMNPEESKRLARLQYESQCKADAIEIRARGFSPLALESCEDDYIQKAQDERQAKERETAAKELKEFLAKREAERLAKEAMLNIFWAFAVCFCCNVLVLCGALYSIFVPKEKKQKLQKPPEEATTAEPINELERQRRFVTLNPELEQAVVDPYGDMTEQDQYELMLHWLFDVPNNEPQFKWAEWAFGIKCVIESKDIKKFEIDVRTNGFYVEVPSIHASFVGLWLSRITIPTQSTVVVLEDFEGKSSFMVIPRVDLEELDSYWGPDEVLTQQTGIHMVA